MRKSILILTGFSFFLIVLADANAAKKKKPASGKTVFAGQLVNHYGLDWNKGPGQYECRKVAVGTEFFTQISQSKCESIAGAKALKTFKGKYAECSSGESKHFNWMIYPTEKICQDQIEALNAPSP